MSKLSLDEWIGLINAFIANGKDHLILDNAAMHNLSEGVARWAKQEHIIRQYDRPKQVMCDACEQGCIVPVQYRYNAQLKPDDAYIDCIDDTIQAGRIFLEKEQLTTWQLKSLYIAEWIARELNLSTPIVAKEGQLHHYVLGRINRNAYSEVSLKLDNQGAVLHVNRQDLPLQQAFIAYRKHFGINIQKINAMLDTYTTKPTSQDKSDKASKKLRNEDMYADFLELRKQHPNKKFDTDIFKMLKKMEAYSELEESTIKRIIGRMKQKEK